MPTPPAVYPHKQRAFYSKNAEEQSNKSEKDGQHSGAGTQYALLIKGSPEGKPKSTWQLRVQKALGRKTRLRAQASALIAPLNLLPSKWQLETRRRLPKGATFNARLQKEDLQQSREISKHRLVLERKARDACWTHTCAYDSTGWQIGLKAKASSGKKRFSHQNWRVNFLSFMRVKSRHCDKIMLKANFSTSL